MSTDEPTVTGGPGIVIERAPPTATLTIDRRGEENRLGRTEIERLGGLADALRDDDEVHAVVVTGAGADFFSAGLLNPVIRASMTKDEVVDFVLLANRVFDAIEALPQVVIAAINGAIHAGAVELALACDIRLAADHARLRMPEARWGGFPGAGAPVRLPMVVGHGRALELIATGRKIDTVEMERIGLVQGVHPPQELAAATAALAEKIAAAGAARHRGRQAHHRHPPRPGRTGGKRIVRCPALCA